MPSGLFMQGFAKALERGIREAQIDNEEQEKAQAAEAIRRSIEQRQTLLAQTEAARRTAENAADRKLQIDLAMIREMGDQRLEEMDNRTKEVLARLPRRPGSTSTIPRINPTKKTQIDAVNKGIATVEKERSGYSDMFEPEKKADATRRVESLYGLLTELSSDASQPYPKADFDDRINQATDPFFKLNQIGSQLMQLQGDANAQ